jgi:hypothetical protein
MWQVPIAIPAATGSHKSEMSRNRRSLVIGGNRWAFPTVEDRDLLQRVAVRILSGIYEQDFVERSQAYRPDVTRRRI